jgi:hypothetical protein
MGRWMEIVREQPPEGQRDHTEEYQRLIVGECAPHPLLSAARAIQRGSRGDLSISAGFPILDRVQSGSSWYVDEDLWLSPDDVVQLLDEFARLRRLCRGEEFVAGLDGQSFATRWRAGDSPAEFERSLDAIEGLLWQAVEDGHWLRLML